MILSLSLSLSSYTLPFQANQSLDDLVPLLEDPCNIQVSHVSHHLLPVLHTPTHMYTIDDYLHVFHSHAHYNYVENAPAVIKGEVP